MISFKNLSIINDELPFHPPNSYRAFKDRLGIAIYYQLSNYNLFIELMVALFPDGEDRPPRLKSEAAQAWTLNNLANSYALSGQPGKAAPLFLMHNGLREKNDDKKNLAIGLGNVAHMAQIYLGQLSAASGHLQKRIALCREIKDEFGEAVGRQEWGRVLTYQGGWLGTEKELAASTAYDEKHNDYQGLSLDYAYRALSLLQQARLSQALPGKAKNAPALSREALKQAGQALEFAEEDARTDYPMPRDFVRAYYLLGEALLQCRQSGAANEIKPLEIRFYDEPFQQVRETLLVKPGGEPAAAERCLSEALRRCRRTNTVEAEPEILLGWAKLEKEKVKSKKGEVKRGKDEGGHLENMGEYVREAGDIAERAGYRLVLADIHLFCAEVLLEMGNGGGVAVDAGARRASPLRGLTAREHLQKAKEYAKDVSTVEDLYQSKDPRFYQGIPEYDMLKRGMTERERIENGYYVACQIAEALEKKIGA